MERRRFEELAAGILPAHFMEDIKKMPSHFTARRLTQEITSGGDERSAFAQSKVVRALKRFGEGHLEAMGKTR